ncbi:unnamed protein product [Arabidopsis halleri]
MMVVLRKMLCKRLLGFGVIQLWPRKKWMLSIIWMASWILEMYLDNRKHGQCLSDRRIK